MALAYLSYSMLVYDVNTDHMTLFEIFWRKTANWQEGNWQVYKRKYRHLSRLYQVCIESLKGCEQCEPRHFLSHVRYTRNICICMNIFHFQGIIKYELHQEEEA